MLQELDYRFTPREKKKVDDIGLEKLSPQLSGAEREVLWCLFKHGPTWDGDIPSKSGRTELVSKGYVAQAEGWNWLTTEGGTLAIARGLHLRKGA